MNKSDERFLVVRLTALGDILHTVPAVAALRAAHAGARIDWVVDRKWAPVLEGSPAIDDVIPFDRRSLLGVIECIQRLQENRYTCAIDFQGRYKSADPRRAFPGAPRPILDSDRAWKRANLCAAMIVYRSARHPDRPTARCWN